MSIVVGGWEDSIFVEGSWRLEFDGRIDNNTTLCRRRLKSQGISTTTSPIGSKLRTGYLDNCLAWPSTSSIDWLIQRRSTILTGRIQSYLINHSNVLNNPVLSKYMDVALHVRHIICRGLLGLVGRWQDVTPERYYNLKRYMYTRVQQEICQLCQWILWGS